MLKSQQQQQLSICLLSGLGLGLGTVLGLGLELKMLPAVGCMSGYRPDYPVDCALLFARQVQ